MEKTNCFDSKMQEIWQDFIVHFKNSGTAFSYQSDITEFVQIAKKNFQDITEKDVRDYYNYQRKRVDSGEIQPSTLAKKIRELNSIAAFIADNREEYGLSKEYQNHFEQYLRIIDKVSKMARNIPIEHIDRLFQAAKDDSFAYCIFTFLYRMGFSTTEIIELKYNMISVFENGTYIFLPGRKEACFVPEDVYRVLEIYWKDYHNTNEYLFVNKQGKKLYPMFISRLMKKYASLAGIPRYSAEALRNSCAYTMFSYQVKSDQVAKEMGVTEKQIQRYNSYNYLNSSSRKTKSMVKVKIEPPMK